MERGSYRHGGHKFYSFRVITRAEFQSAEAVTINQGSSVNVRLTVKPSNLTQEEVSHIQESVGIISDAGETGTGVISNYVGYSDGVVTIRLYNHSIPAGSSVNIRARLRYEPIPSSDYIDTINTKQIIGGVTG